MEQVKVFEHTSTELMEREFNAWLKDRPPGEITRVVQVFSDRFGTFFTTIFYKPFYDKPKSDPTKPPPTKAPGPGRHVPKP